MSNSLRLHDLCLPGSSVHGISQVRILEQVAISFSREIFLTHIEPVSPALAGRFFATEPPGKPKVKCVIYCRITNYLKAYWLKGEINIYYLM